MAKYNTVSVMKAKTLLTARLSYVIKKKLEHTSQRALSDRLDMSAGIISKLKRGIHRGVSFDAILEVATRLNCKVRLVIDINGQDRPVVEVQLEPLF